MAASRMTFAATAGTTVLSVVTVESGPVTILRAAGDLDMDTSGRFTRHLARAVAVFTPRVLIVDLADLSFLGAAGITALLDGGDRVGRAGGQLRLRRLSGPARLALGAGRTLDLFDVEDEPAVGTDCRSGRTMAD
ncbi:STAS domain-containing protein [Actinoplanes sp. NPDC004185]